jgi:hypothetical protein
LQGKAIQNNKANIPNDKQYLIDNNSDMGAFMDYDGRDIANK